MDTKFSTLKKYGKRMLAVLIIAAVVLVIAVVELVLPYWPIVPIKRTNGWRPENFGMRAENLDLQVDTSIILRGYLLLAAAKPKATIIMLHGISGFKEVYLPFAKHLTTEGFNVVVFDQRAHGVSGGQFCTFGFYEKYDVSKYIDTIERRFGNLPIGIHGSSMGGAVALQSLAHDKRLRFGIVESTFNTLENVVAQYGQNFFGIKSTWLAQRVLNKAAVIARFDPFSVKPVEACQNIEQPMLLVHGERDERIPVAFNQDNFQNLKTVDKEFFIVPNAGHNDVSAKGGALYVHKYLTFLKRVTATAPQYLAH